MKDYELRSLVAALHQDALTATNASKLSKARSDASAYYLGEMSADMPTAAGRSSAVSMDVADTIEGMMPQLMEIFAGSDEVVKFDPVGPEDVDAAQQETDYVNHVFMNQNPGFLVLYSFIKDALLSKVGIVKVWWETREEEQRETYYDKTDDEFALIASDPDVEVIEHSARPADQPSEENSEAQAPANDGYQKKPRNDPHPLAPVAQIAGALGLPQPMLHDVTVVMKRTYAQAKVLGVPPEEFGIERNARNIKDCNYCFHKVVDRTVAQLITQGYDAEQCRRLPTYRAWSNVEEINRDTVDEHANAGNDAYDDSSRTVAITEHYVRMDYEGNGKPCLYRVVSGGDGGEGVILKLDGKPDVQEWDSIPFAAITPVIVTHRFWGRSVADIVMDIQRIKTALFRGLLDNMYMVTNPRVEVSKTHSTDDTLDDLLVSRPNGIIRVSQPGGINWQVVPSIGQSVYPALEYMDTTREWRTGVTKQGQGVDANALQNQSATAVAQAFSASQAKVQLIAKIFAETGVKDLFWLLHGLIKKHADKAATVRLRNQWVTVDPREWKSREDLTVEVGLGTGGKQQKLAAMMQIAALQEKVLVNGLTNLVTTENLYNTAKEITKVLGKPNTDTFFTDPKTQPAPQPKPDPKMQELQLKAQLETQKAQQNAELQRVQAKRQAQLEREQMQADLVTQRQKTEQEMAIARQRFDLERQLKIEEFQMKREEHQMTREKHNQALELASAKQKSG